MKINLKKIKAHCEQNSEMSREVIDEFLMPYAGQTNRLGREMNQHFDRYRHITKDFPSFVPMLQAQYLVHGIFKHDGVIRKYLNHADLKSLSVEKRKYLEYQKANPWRFSFAEILKSLENDFYEMLDVFTGEKYLLYSPSIEKTLNDYSYQLWFNLIAFNGECYVTYGPVVGYQAFTPDDIFFFATELTDEVETDDDLYRVVEKNPVPFMMLVTGSTLPAIVGNDDHELIIAFSEFYVPDFPDSFPEDVFDMDEISGVVRLTLAGEEGPPHFATAYYDREGELLHLTSMTLYGYLLLVEAFDNLFFDFEAMPDLLVSIQMKNVTEQILKRDVTLFPYEPLFTGDLNPLINDIVIRMNQAMEEMIPVINQGEYPDISALATKYDVEEDALKQLVENVWGLTKKK